MIYFKHTLVAVKGLKQVVESERQRSAYGRANINVHVALKTQRFKFKKKKVSYLEELKSR